MFRPSPCLNARLRLTTKQVNGGYYKGNRTGNVGFFGFKKGTYYIDYRKVRTYAVPEGLDDFKLTPFVTKKMAPTKNAYTKTVLSRGGHEIQLPRAYSGKDFLEDWMRENGDEVKEVEERQAKQAGQQRRKEKEAKAKSAEANAEIPASK